MCIYTHLSISMYMCMNVNIFPYLMNCSTERFFFFFFFYIQNIIIINISIIIIIIVIEFVYECVPLSFCPFLPPDLVYSFIFLFVCVLHMYGSFLDGCFQS